MPARWKYELICKNVELYKEHECLWYMNSTLYKRKDARKCALVEIVRKMGLENFTTEDAKQKIKSLTLSLGKKRATYQQESHKIEKSLSPGAGLVDVYKPSMKWFTF
jgi:Leu/Phe-tRNA-protein transferase